MPFQTPFHSRTSILCNSQEWRNWSGYLSVAKFNATHDAEYYSVRSAAGLLDISPLYKYDITGPDALIHVDKIMTRDLTKLKIGQVLYSPWCDEKGKIIDDGTISRIGANHFRVTAADPSLRWFEDCGFGMNSNIKDISRELAALAIQGPKSRGILISAGIKTDLNKLNYYWLDQTKIGGLPITITRTGYTGDLGYELWVPRDHAEQLWDILVDTGNDYGLMPIGLIALDMLRIEAGLLLIDVDYVSTTKALIEEQKSSPFDIGLGWAVKLNAGNFVGKNALIKEKNSGAKWKFVGFDINWESLEQEFGKVDLPPQISGQASRDPLPIYKNNKQIGQVTSIAFSPVLKKFIALGTLESKFGKIGSTVDIEITVEYSREKAKAKVVKLPFFNPKRKRALIDD